MEKIIMFRRILKKSIAVLVVIILTANYPLAAFADDATTLTAAQLGNMIDGMESITTQLKDMGLSEEDIKELLEVPSRESSFYSSSNEVVPYSGQFIAETKNEGNAEDIMLFSSYDGNPPSSASVQRERIENIFLVAPQNYKTDYYQGSSNTATDFGEYLKYLYVSHYIDGPGRAPNDRDMPYIISTQDIQVYENFLDVANMASLFSGIASLGAAVWGSIDYATAINNINTADITIAQKIATILQFGSSTYDVTEAMGTIGPIVNSYVTDNIGSAGSENQLTADTVDYIESQLSGLGFYENFEENATKSIIGVLASLFIGITSLTLSVFGMFISAIPLFTYTITGLSETVALYGMGNSFSGRYAVRTAIAIGM